MNGWRVTVASRRLVPSRPFTGVPNGIQLAKLRSALILSPENMSLIHRLERRFGRFAIPNLTGILIIGQVALYFLAMVREDLALDRVLLVPELVLQGQVWRLVTFLFTPPTTNPLFAMIFWSLMYLFGTSLEQYWGSFRFNVFLLLGYLANVAAAFIAHFAGEAVITSNAYLYSTIFLAFARLYPDFVLNIMFILPVKVKWLALLMWLSLGYALLVGSWTSKLLIIASVLNYLLFFGREHVGEWKQVQRRRSYQAKATRAAATAKHRCSVCGLTSDDSPKTLFRYCSKCSGQQGYCPDHIHDHEHIVD